MGSSPLLEVSSVSKTFRVRRVGWPLAWGAPQRIRGLDSVSLTVRPGEVVGLVGPNGAGKTTLINVICDLVRADAGQIRIAGHTIPDHVRQAQRQIGLLSSGERSFFWRLSGRQNLEFFAALQGLALKPARRRAGALIDQFGLSEHADRAFSTYSAGMKKRLGLARLLLHEPSLLLMDEATNGLDPAAAEELMEHIRTQAASNGRGVLWATHRWDEVIALGDRAVVLMEGRVRFSGPASRFAELCTDASAYKIEFESPLEQREAIMNWAHSVGGRLETRDTVGWLFLDNVTAREGISPVLHELLKRGAYIRRVEPERAPIKAVLAHLREDSGEPTVEE